MEIFYNSQGMTVVAAIQPQDLHLLAQAQSVYSQQSQNNDNGEKEPLLK